MLWSELSVVGVTGLEPATSRSQSVRSKPSELHPVKYQTLLYATLG